MDEFVSFMVSELADVSLVASMRFACIVAC
ncbi:hypothetical protein BSFP_051840 [Burkholderia stabilis]|uniref:Uncharacterized protein n=1 Tax=Burkholderia stabilis TaxID=95485 RepID=A0A1Y1BY02_9BURK|nr:hypothetical protein BSFP_051840 [Burkholderia stabilis]